MTLSAAEHSQIRALARDLYRDSPRIARALDPSGSRSIVRHIAGIACLLSALALIFMDNVLAAVVAAALSCLGSLALRPFMD